MQPVVQGAPSARVRTAFSRFARGANVVGRTFVAVGLFALLAGAVVNPPSTDVASDSVGATKGTFGVSETGAATYSLPIYTTPGVAGFAPKISLEYNSQGGDGPLGKGWSIAGSSMISRCRAARETADFAGDNQSSANGAGPITMTSSDRLCLDGQRLVPASTPASGGACEALSGATVTEYRTEIESNQRVCAYRWAAADVNGAPLEIGLRFFTVEGQDGTTSWYGDRRQTAGDIDDAGAGAALLTESVSLSKKAVHNGTAWVYVDNALFNWALTRKMDASGNYIDYDYAAKVGQEIYLGRVAYTGKKQLAGQATPGHDPANEIAFTYTAKPTFALAPYLHGGHLFSQSQALRTITVKDTAREVRHYTLAYNDADSIAQSYGGVGFNLTSVQECADTTKAVCYPATRFDWSRREYLLASPDVMTPPSFGSRDKFDGYKLGDVDGDGLQDMVRLKDDASCSNEEVSVAFSTIDANGKVQLVEPAQKHFCTPREIVGTISNEGNAWFLFDYDGDGRDDLFTAGDDSDGGYVLYKSQGRPTSSTMPAFVETNVVSGLMPAPGNSDELAQLADMNGDGLLDVFYKRNGAFKARLMERNASGFAWGTERSVVANPWCPADTSGADWTCRLVTPKVVKTNGGVHMYDFNGDARSDLLFKNIQHCDGCQDREYLDAYGITQITASTITLGWVGLGIETTTIEADHDDRYKTIYSRDHRFGDFNGDGITEVIFRQFIQLDPWGETPGSGDWVYGAYGSTILAEDDEDWGLTTALQIVDVNGDGRDDIFTASPWTGVVRYGQPSGGLTEGRSLWTNVHPTGCGSFGCQSDYMFIFSDFDGDAGMDLLSILWEDTDIDMSMFRSLPAKRYVPRDAIVAVTDGLGVRTDVAYLPLTLKDQYRRDLGSRNALNVGRGSPVQDVLAPMYVVNNVRTDSPTAADAAARRTVHYRYAGAKIQAGGRGFLGFREVTAIDTGFAGKHVATTTTYRQDFPYIGKPLSQVTVVANGTYAPGACATPATMFASGCFAGMSGSFPAIAGTKVSETVYDWTSPNFDGPTQLATPTQIPVRIELRGTDSRAYDLASGALTSEVSTEFTYDAWGNALTTVVGTYTGAADPTPTVKTTTSTYLNDAAKWHIGRMLTSSVAHARAGTTVTRRTAFTYDANTGLLTSERIEPNGLPANDLRTEYVLDDFGNRTASYTCSQNFTSAQCRSKATVVNVWNSMTQVHRYTYRNYDATGRFVVSSYEPFRKAGSTWGTGEREDVKVQQVEGIDKFGNVVHVSDHNGVHVASSHGAMGRPYWTWTQTVAGAAAGSATGGIDSFTTYRLCPQVACPTGAAFRVRVAVDGQPTRWTYFDKLGRTVLVVNQTHNVGMGDMDLAGVCTWYDGAGRVHGVSNPFFLKGAFGTADPTFAEQPCVQAARNVTYTYYDVLGRPTQVLAPDATMTTMAYDGLTTVTTNALLQTKSETKNALGQLVSSKDNHNFVTSYEYDSTGNLTKVSRNAGRGAIVTQMWYDLLGRRTRIVDPDAGNRTFSFNPAGEQLAESDGVMWSAKRYDFKGRVIWEGVKNLPGETNPYESAITRTYDTADYGRGQLASTASTGTYYAYLGQTGMDVAHAVGHDYDTLGRRIATATVVDGTNYAEEVRYDALGRAWKQQDATGRWLKTEFTARGTMQRVCETELNDATPGCVWNSASTYYDRIKVNERGDVLMDRRGGQAALTGKRTYDPLTGAVLTICNGANADGCQIVDDKYHWDDVGNLIDRENISFREHFQYDEMNRLQEAYYTKWNGAATAAATSVMLTYDLLGNICSKYENGGTEAYRYGGLAGCGLMPNPGSAGGNAALSPHAVISLTKLGKTAATYSYDARGNQVQTLTGSGAVDRTIKYTLWDQAHEIQRGTRASRFWYADGGVRYKRDDITYSGTTPIATTRTIVVGNVEFVSGSSGSLTRRNIAGVMFQQTPTTGTGAGVSTNYFLHHDHLGNLVAITNTSGAILERLAYSAFGDRISPTALNTPGVSNRSRRGFTGHEQFELLNVVHMNGRIYDPTLGRFLQVDPVVQDPSNGQNYNRYTYVWNNPLAYTDPTGMISVKNLVRQIVGIYVSAYLGSSTNLFGSMAGGTFANSVGSLVGSYVAGGKNNVGLNAAYDFGSASGPSVEETEWRSTSYENDGEESWSQSLAGGSDADSCQCKNRVGKPSNPTWKMLTPNESWRDNISVVDEGDVTVIRISLTVSGAGSAAQLVANDVNSNWNATAKYDGNGRLYRMEIHVTPVKKDGDWKIRYMPKHKWLELNSEICDGQVGAKNAHGTSLLELPLTDVWKEPQTAAHEFGHALGLTHAPKGSGSILSYPYPGAPPRQVTGQDLFLIAETYRAK